MPAPATFLRGRDLLIFEQHRETREVEEFERVENERPRRGPPKTATRSQWEAKVRTFLSSDPKAQWGKPQWQLLYLSVPDEGGSSACCQLAEELARREARISIRVLPLRHEPNECELPRIVKETKCTSDLVRTLLRHHELSEEFRPKKAFRLFLMVIGCIFMGLSPLFAFLINQLASQLPIDVSFTHVLLLFALLGAMAVAGNVALAKSQKHPTPELEHAVAASINDLHAREDGLYGELVSHCARRLCSSPLVMIIDEFSSLRPFTRDTVIRVLEDDTLTTQYLFRLVVAENADDARLWKEMGARNILSHTNISHSSFLHLTPLTREACLRLCKAAGGDLHLVDSNLPLKSLLRPCARDADLSAGPPVKWEVLDVLRAGYTSESVQITYSEFQSLCTGGALPVIGKARKYSVLTVDAVDRAISKQSKNVPGLTGDGNIRLDLLTPSPQADGALHFIWCQHWCQRARRKTADLWELRLAAHQAERSILEGAILDPADARRFLPSFCEAAWSAITACIKNTMFREAARLTECILRVQGWVRETKGSEQRDLLGTLELISARVLWHVGLVTGDRAGLVRAYVPAAGESDEKEVVAPELRALLGWYIRLLGTSEESVGRVLRWLLATDRRVSKEDRWLLIESFLLEASFYARALDYSVGGSGGCVATDECGGLLPNHLDWGSPAYWAALLETESEHFWPEIRTHMCCLGIRLAAEDKNLEAALAGLELLLASVAGEPAERENDQRSLLLRAVNVEVRATALEMCIRAARPMEPQQNAPGPATRYRYRARVLPKELQPSVLSILHELQLPAAAQPEARDAEMVFPATLHELAQRLYRDLAMLWEDFGLDHRAAWAQVWRSKYMLSASHADFLAPPGNDELRGALDGASRIQGPVSYVVNLVGANACRGMHDIAKGYLLRAAAQSWRLGTDPALVAKLTYLSLRGKIELGRPRHRELATSILEHLRDEENGSTLWCSLPPEVRGVILCHLLQAFARLEERKAFDTCARLSDRLGQVDEISSKIREWLGDATRFGRLAFELSDSDVDDFDAWMVRWTGAQHSRGHVGFLVMLWRRLSAIDHEAAADTYVEIIESIQDIDTQGLLLYALLPIGKPEHVQRLGPIATTILSREEAGLTFEEQRSFAELMYAFEHKEELLDYMASRTYYILEREKSEGILDAMRAGDALAIVFVYHENFQYLKPPMASRDEDMVRFLKSARPGSDELLSLSSVPEMVIGSGSETSLCVEFFLLVGLLMYDRNELYQSLRTQASKTARQQIGEFFDALLGSGDVDAETVSLIRSHREYVVGGLQGWRATSSRVD